MDRYGVEGVQLISAQPVGLQINRGQRQGKENRRQGKDQRKKEDKRKKNKLILEDQVTLMLRHQPNESFMLDAPTFLKAKKNKMGNNREGPDRAKKRIDIKV